MSIESQQIRQSFNNEGYRAAIISARFNRVPTVKQIHVELISDYDCPDPFRTYKMKIRFVSQTKGRFVNYNKKL
ncbi:MAG: hypothetical protein CK425_00950 [Parachlamydia sp.]|nr:MAG: hypothetical protein CK425_00950 [Parachlamydia sp.]